MSGEDVSISIGHRRVGRGHPLFVIAEIGLNHGGSIDRALTLVDAAAAAGASAVKVQTLVADELVAPSCPAPAHVTASSLREFFAAFELDEPAHDAIATRTRMHGMAMIGTPLSESAVDLLLRIGVDAFKIASGDLTWPHLIGRCAQSGRPVILSSGMATVAEIERGLTCARLGGASEVALLHCVSAYPVPPGSENLRAIATLAARFPVPVGLSDHSADTFAVPIAVTLGASLYERHLVLAPADGSVDAAVSSTPQELSALIRAAARTAGALGTGDKVCSPAEAVNLVASRRGLYAARALVAGHIVTAGDVIALRPASALSPDRYAELVGSRIARDIEAGGPFLAADVEDRAAAKGHRDVA